MTMYGCCADVSCPSLLLHSLQDLLSRFHGSWELRPIKDASGKTTGCHAVLSQDVLPKGEAHCFACTIHVRWRVVPCDSLPESTL
jgi:hypothetical protein